MITLQHIEEGLSRAYLMAVVARAGAIIYSPQFDYGVDGTIARVRRIAGGRYVEDGVKFDFQLKASTRWQLHGDSLNYALEAKTYNDIVRRSVRAVATPLLLILMCLPEDQTAWLDNDEQRMVLRNCCYWTTLSGDLTDNQNTVTISIPRRRLLTPSTLVELLTATERGLIS
jgi:Domain of unknown function (DUF4365)